MGTSAESSSEVLDVLVVGGGPAGTAAAFRAKELGLSVLVIDYDDVLKRIRDYAKDKLILPDYGGGDKLLFPDGGDFVRRLHFSPIDKDEMHDQWKRFYEECDVPVRVGVEFTGLERREDGIWYVKSWDHHGRKDLPLLARHVVLGLGRGVPRRFDIPGDTDGIGFRLDDPDTFVSGPVCVIGGGTSAAEAVIAISNSKAAAGDPSCVYWSYRGDKMPRVSKALAEVFFEAYVGNGNVRYFPRSEPAAVITADDRNEYLSIRIDRRCIDGRPAETSHIEFPKESCIACIGEDLPEALLASVGIHMIVGGPKTKKRMVVNRFLETALPNVYMVGDMLCQAYLETPDFAGDPATFDERKHRGNIKTALRDGVFVAQVIAQKVAGKEEIDVSIADAEAEAVPEAEALGRSLTQSVEVRAASIPGVEPPAESSGDGVLVRILPGGVASDEFSIQPSGTTRIGSKDCDIVFAEDSAIGESHASIVHGTEGYVLRDDGAASGVFLRALPGHAVALSDRDIVRAGRQFLVVAGNDALRHFDRAGKEVGRYALGEKTLVMGRDAPDHVLDPDDKTLSRRHLAVSAKSGQITLKDLKSVNGTFVKVRRATLLNDGDEFRIGNQLLRLVVPGNGAVQPQDSNSAEAEAVHAAPESPPPAVDTPPAEAPSASAADSQSDSAAVGGEPAVTFQPAGKTLALRPGQTLCEVAEENGIDIVAECHSGICGSDPVRIISGAEHLNAPEDAEVSALEDICELEAPQCRLACMVRARGPVVVELISQDD